MKPIEIVLVEDDVNILEVTRLFLENEGYKVYTATNAFDGLFLMESISPSVAILDINLPDKNGFELAKKFREISDGILFFVTGEITKEKVMLGFEVGCDDYITKPFDPQELVARVKANVRRIKKKEFEFLKIGDLYIDYKNATVQKNGELLDLSKKEKMLLFYLTRHPNRVVSTETLFDNVWGYDAMSDIKTVSVHMSTLRKKIESDPTKPKYIETVRGFGYKFNM